MDTGRVIHTGNGAETRRRCVVWHRDGVAARAELVRALSSRGLRVETSVSGHEVLAMGCAVQQKVDGGGSGLIVVLDGGGGDLPEQGRVLEAMERFCPSGLVWAYEHGANPPLRGVVGKGKARVGSGLNGAVPVGVESSERVAGSGARLRLAGGDVQEKSAAGSGGGDLRASDVLDQDELAALLKPNDG